MNTQTPHQGVAAGKSYHVIYEPGGPGFIDARGRHYTVAADGSLISQRVKMSKQERRFRKKAKRIAAGR